MRWPYAHPKPNMLLPMHLGGPDQDRAQQALPLARAHWHPKGSVCRQAAGAFARACAWTVFARIDCENQNQLLAQLRGEEQARPHLGISKDCLVDRGKPQGIRRAASWIAGSLRG